MLLLLLLLWTRLVLIVIVLGESDVGYAQADHANYYLEGEGERKGNINKLKTQRRNWFSFSSVTLLVGDSRDLFKRQLNCNH